jgi:thymidylate synthase
MLLGFPHDVAGFALLQSILAQKLGVAAGIYSHSISNAHIYDIHYEQAKELIARNSSQEKIVLNLPPDSFKRAEKGDKNLVLEISDNLSAQYAPLPALKGLKIVL